PNPTGARERDRARPLGVHRIDQQVGGRDLNEKRGMPDERDDHVVRSGVRRPARLDRDPRRPRGSWREQHARHHPNGLALRAARIEKPAAIKVIGAACHVTDNGERPAGPQSATPAGTRSRRPCSRTSLGSVSFSVFRKVYGPGPWRHPMPRSRMRWSALLFFALQPMPALVGQASPPAAPTSRSAISGDRALRGLDDFVARVMKEWQVPGLALGVIQDGKPVLLKGYGYRDVEKRLPVTPRTLMAIGSN